MSEMNISDFLLGVAYMAGKEGFDLGWPRVAPDWCEGDEVAKWLQGYDGCICDVRPGTCDSDVNVYAVCPVHKLAIWEALERAGIHIDKPGALEKIDS